MILQALYDYYQRKAADPECGIAPEGWEWKPIPFLVAIDQDGKYLHIRDTREIDGKKKVAKSILVPRAVGRSGKDACDLANLFWDHYGYVLQIPKEDTDKAREMSFKQFNAFLGRLKALPEYVRVLPVVRALLKFYDLEEFRKLSAVDRENCLKVAGGNLTFFVEPFGMVVENPDVKAYVDGLVKLSGNAVVGDDDEGEIYSAVCLITGQKGLVQRKHARTSINKDTMSLVAIQKGAGYDSYGKQQAFNCPVGLSAEFAYTTALNALLKNAGNRLQLSDTTVVFWTQNKRFFRHLRG